MNCFIYEKIIYAFFVLSEDRLATIFFTIISASISATNYQADYLAYKKVLRFEDCFKSGFKLGMNLVIPAEGYLVTNFVNLVFSIGKYAVRQDYDKLVVLNHDENCANL